MLMDATDGYNENAQLLDSEYGCPYKMSLVYLIQMSDCKSIKLDVATCLKQYPEFMMECRSAMRSLSYLHT